MPRSRAEPCQGQDGEVLGDAVGEADSETLDHAAGDPVGDEGRAMLELIWLAVLVLIPIVYILLSLLRLQSTSFAVAQAAREAGRLLDNAPSVSAGVQQALAVARQTLADQNVPAEGLVVRYVSTGASCDTAAGIAPDLTSGATYDICVTVPLVLPLLPEGITAANRMTGVYTLHVGEFRESR